MRSWRRLLPLAAVLGCSDLTEGSGGVVSLEVTAPPSQIEVGDTIALQAVALDRNGQPVAAEIGWRSPDTTLTIEPEGPRAIGRFPGPGRIQAVSGTLASGLSQLTVAPRVDTVAIPGPTELIVAPEAPASEPLVALLQTFTPAGPVSGRPIIYEIVEPVFPDPATRTVELTGGVLLDTLTTDATGGPATPVAVQRVAGAVVPESVVVEVRAFRKDVIPVPGSGQRFIVRFQQPPATP